MSRNCDHAGCREWFRCRVRFAPKSEIFESKPSVGATHPETMQCPTCEGSGLYGYVHGQHMPCPYCDGSGVVPVQPAGEPCANPAHEMLLPTGNVIHSEVKHRYDETPPSGPHIPQPSQGSDEQSWLGNPPELWRIIDATRTEAHLGVSAEYPDMTLTADQAVKAIQALLARTGQERETAGRIDEVVRFRGALKGEDNWSEYSLQRLAALRAQAEEGKQ